MIWYNITSKTVLDNYSTSSSTNTEIDVAFIKPGSSRDLSLQSLRVQGRGVSLGSLTGLVFRLKKWPTTASSGGTAITPTPVIDRMPACAATAGAAATATGAVTPGTGTALYIGGCGCSATGPGLWTAQDVDAPIGLDAGANKSIDLISESGGASMLYDWWQEFSE